MPKSSAEAISPLPNRSRLRWNRGEARAVIAELEASGMTVEKFAEREGLKLERLARWKRKLETSETARRSPKFIELRPAPAKLKSARLELVLRSGHVLFFGESFDPDSLRRILELLERDAGC